jgi:hypothetical protein
MARGAPAPQIQNGKIPMFKTSEAFGVSDFGFVSFGSV